MRVPLQHHGGSASAVAVICGLLAALALALAAPAHAASGTWERAWGKNVNGGGVFGVCTVAASCLAGDSTTALGGEMNRAEDVAIDGAGYVYVVDSFNNRIQKFDSNGNFLRAWGRNVVKDGGTGQVCTDAAAGTPATPCFEICTVAADCQIGGIGGLGGEMNLPRGIVVDGAGKVYVADRYNYRIQKFDSNGTFERTWGKGVNMTVPGNLCTAASTNTCQTGTIGGGAGEFNAPKGVAIGSGGSVYVADTDNHRIQRFNSNGTFQLTWGKGVDMTTPGNLCPANPGDTCQAGTPGVLAGEMSVPRAVDTDAAGNVYVAEQDNNRVQKFDSAGTFERAWGRNVVKDGGTGAVCTDAQAGNPATACFEICTVPADCQIGADGGLGGEMLGLRGIATDAAGNVYVADTNHNRIQKFDSNGSFQRTWGNGVNGGAGFEVCTVAASCQSGGTGDLGGEMNLPYGITTDSAGNLYVTEFLNNRVQKFADPAGSGGAAVAPSNAFTIGKLKGRTLILHVSAAGTAEVTDAGAQAAGRRALAAARKLLKPSSASGGPGTIAVKLKLTKAANRKLRERGKLKVKARISFTPTGGTRNSQTAKLKLKKG